MKAAGPERGWIDLRSAARTKLDGLYDWFERKYRVTEYRRAAARRKKLLGGGYDCRKEYREKVLPYWKPYGVRPGRIWYRLLSHYSHEVDPRCIPDDLWFDRILPYYSNSSFRRFGEDKNYLSVWFPDARLPRTVVSRVAGVYYDENFRFLTEPEAVRLCADTGRFVLKPSVDSGEGRQIRFFDGADSSAAAVEAAFARMGDNFIAQEIVEQHGTIRRLNPDSLNTLRIITFLFENEVRVLSAILRIGGKGAKVDNIGAGGFACAVNPDGRLSRFAINRRSERCETTPDGVRFDSVTVPGYGEAVRTVRRLHQRLAHFKIIGWDMAINENAEPVLIEYNTAPGQNQYCCGPTFGDLTEKVLTDVFLTKEFRNSRN